MVSLDSKREWYRYHALFAQALCNRLGRIHADLVPILHYRASLWYAEHNQMTQAILHALYAQEWQWAADLIEQAHLPLLLLTWGGKERELFRLREWLERLPAEVMYARPQLYLACAQILWQVAPPSLLQHWLDTAEATLITSLTTQMHENGSSTILTSPTRQEQENLLGGVIAWRAFLLSFDQDAEVVFPLCQRALTLLSAENSVGRRHVAWAQHMAYYTSSANDAMATLQGALQTSLLVQAAGVTADAINHLATITLIMLGIGQLHETQRYIEQARLLATQPGGMVLPEVGWSLISQVEILREWNELDAALSLAEEAISLCKKTESIVSLMYVLYAYAVLVRVYLSRRDYDAACFALEEFEQIGMGMNQHVSLLIRSLFTTIDQIRLWLACGELDRATRWAEALDVRERHSNPLVCEREEVACVRVLLAKQQPNPALERLEPVLRRATTGQRWGHVIEMRLLQALAYRMSQQETQALDALSEALRLAEPEGYLRSFVDEGASMAALLSLLREQQRKAGPTPYLDTLLAAFQEPSKAQKRPQKRR